MSTRYTVEALLKHTYNNEIVTKQEKFNTDVSCIAFSKQLSTNRYWKDNRELVLVGKPTIYIDEK